MTEKERIAIMERARQHLVRSFLADLDESTERQRFLAKVRTELRRRGVIPTTKPKKRSGPDEKPSS